MSDEVHTCNSHPLRTPRPLPTAQDSSQLSAPRLWHPGVAARSGTAAFSGCVSPGLLGLGPRRAGLPGDPAWVRQRVPGRTRPRGVLASKAKPPPKYTPQAPGSPLLGVELQLLLLLLLADKRHGGRAGPGPSPWPPSPAPLRLRLPGAPPTLHPRGPRRLGVGTPARRDSGPEEERALTRPDAAEVEGAQPGPAQPRGPGQTREAGPGRLARRALLRSGLMVKWVQDQPAPPATGQTLCAWPQGLTPKSPEQN